MGAEPWAVASVVVATLLAAVASLLLKKGAHGTHLSRTRIKISVHVVIAVTLYLLSSAFFFLGLLGGPLSTLAPLTAIEYVWIVLLAHQFLGEKIEPWKGVGIACIAAGVMLVGLGS